MSEARRRRRAMEKAFGFKKPTNALSKEAIDLRNRKIKAGKEIHRQNLENDKNKKVFNDTKNSDRFDPNPLKLDIENIESTISLKNNPYDPLGDNDNPDMMPSGT